MSDRRPSSLERAVKHTEFDPKWHRLDLKVRAVGGCLQEDRCQIFENRFQKLKLRDNPGSKAQRIWPELTSRNHRLELKVGAVVGCLQEDQCQIFENRFQKSKLLIRLCTQICYESPDKVQVPKRIVSSLVVRPARPVVGLCYSWSISNPKAYVNVAFGLCLFQK